MGANFSGGGTMRNQALWLVLWSLILMNVGEAASGAENVLAPLAFQSSGGWRRPSEAQENQHASPNGQQQQQQINQAKAQSEVKGPPPGRQWPSADSARLKQTAEELANLAQSVPPDVDQTTKGILPKDLEQKLKRIEKLAKQLRSGITH
jgi:hypothetical protein